MLILPKASASGRKALENYVGLGRSAAQSHFRAAVNNPPPGLGRPPLQDFDNKDIWPWITGWIKTTFGTDIESIFVPSAGRHPFEPYPATGEQGHYDLNGLLRPDGSILISLAGDWGTGTDVANGRRIDGGPKARHHGPSWRRLLCWSAE